MCLFKAFLIDTNIVKHCIHVCRSCRPVAGAGVEVWYGAGRDSGGGHYIWGTVGVPPWHNVCTGDAYYTFGPGDENCLEDNRNCDGKLYYRGKSETSGVWSGVLYLCSTLEILYIISQTGGYEFMATFPGVYSKRPILHYHVLVSPLLCDYM